jgi:putative endonuclease
MIMKAANTNIMAKQPCVYVLASQPRGTLYIGVTSNLEARLFQHRAKTLRGFSARYGTYRLVRYEMFEDMASAIKREKQLKNWHRDWKINLIERENLYWEDLAVGLGFDPLPPYTKPSP